MRTKTISQTYIMESTAKEKKFLEADAGDGTLREEQYLTGVPLVLCVCSILLCLFVFALDQTIVATAVTTIGNEFNAIDQIGWLTTAFLLPVVVCCVFWGKISIIFGRKHTMLVGVALFEIGSVVCAVAKDMNTLIGGRVIAGIGGSAIQSLAFMINNEVTPIDKRGLIFAATGANFSIASVLGPLVGGVFVLKVSWRWCFYINLPIGAVAVAFFFYSFNPPRPRNDIIKELKKIDYLGLVLMTSGLVLFLVGLSFGSESGYEWNSGLVISFLVLGILLIISFGIENFMFSKNPMLDVNVTRVWTLQATAIAFAFLFAYYLSSLVYLSVYFQNIKGRDALLTGLSLFALIVPVITTTVITPIGMNKSRYVKPFSILAGLSSAVGTGLFTLLDVNSTHAQTIGYLILAGVGNGFGFPAYNLAGQLDAPSTTGGTLNTTVYLIFCRVLGGSLGTIFSNVVYNETFREQLSLALNSLTDQTLLQEFATVDLMTLATSTELMNDLSTEGQAFVKRQIMKALKAVFYLQTGFGVACAILSFLSTNKRVPQRHEIQERDISTIKQKDGTLEISAELSD